VTGTVAPFVTDTVIEALGWIIAVTPDAWNVIRLMKVVASSSCVGLETGNVDAAATS
jgi:hypothetical protein